MNECLPTCTRLMGFPGCKVIKSLPASVGDARNAGSIPGSVRSSGGGNSKPFQYSCLENSRDRGASVGLRVRHDWATEHHHHYMCYKLAFSANIFGGLSKQSTSLTSESLQFSETHLFMVHCPQPSPVKDFLFKFVINKKNNLLETDCYNRS